MTCNCEPIEREFDIWTAGGKESRTEVVHAETCPEHQHYGHACDCHIRDIVCGCSCTCGEFQRRGLCPHGAKQSECGLCSMAACAPHEKPPCECELCAIYRERSAAP